MNFDKKKTTYKEVTENSDMYVIENLKSRSKKKSRRNNCRHAIDYLK